LIEDAITGTKPTSPDPTDETPTTLQPAGIPVVLAASTFGSGIDGANNVVLGVTDVAQADDSSESESSISTVDPQVLQSTTGGDESESAVDVANQDGCYEMFGICWYWYAIPVISMLGYGLYRYTRDDE
jgi:hypothetical protein